MKGLVGLGTRGAIDGAMAVGVTSDAEGSVSSFKMSL